MPLTWLDIILIGVMLVSGLLAMMRGITREILALLAWVGAFVATLVMYPVLKAPVREKINSDILADTLIIGGVFIAVLVIISVVTMRFTDVLLESRVGALDRTLGFIFGILRGLVLVVIAYLFFAWLVPRSGQPEWVKEARTLPLIVGTGDYIRSVLPEEMPQEIFDKIDPRRPQESERPDKPDPEPEQQPGVIPENNQESSNQGYRSSERSGMDQLLESSAASQQ